MKGFRKSVKRLISKLDDNRLHLLAEKWNASNSILFFLFLLSSLISFFSPLKNMDFLDDLSIEWLIILAFIEFAVLIVFFIIGFNFILYNKKLQKHNKKIKKLQREYNKSTILPFTGIRILWVIAFTILSFVFFWFIYENPYESEIIKKITTDAKSIISITTLTITAPIAFIIWIFRDKNKLLELENARKDTNLKEFQQLQRWATGNIEGDKDNQDNKIALQISALHSLRAYLKGEYGDSFRRGAYEIFRASLATQHQKILKQVNEGEFENITIAINSCQLTKQLNIIASEEWFNLLINHNFPTNDISLLGVNLSKSYLHHRTYGKILDLEGAQLQGANLWRAQLQGVHLWGAELQGADLWSAQLQGANLRRAQLQGVDLWGAKLQGANLREAQLQGANLGNAQLQGVDLWDAELQGADLWRAQLQWASLRGAQLQGAYANNQPEPLNFEQRIKQQINQDTTEEIQDLMYKTLDDTQKSQLIAELKAVGSMCATEAIERIKSASETLDLSEASTGKYSQQEADKWLNDYHQAMKKQ